MTGWRIWPTRRSWPARASSAVSGAGSTEPAGPSAEGHLAVSTSFRSLAAASLVVMLGFVASRILGLVRNMAILSQFGAGREYEAYLAAIAIPDLVFQVLAGGAVGSAFIPVFNRYFARGEAENAWRLTNSVISLAFLITLPVALILALVARPVTELLVPGWDAESKELTAQLMRIML